VTTSQWLITTIGAVHPAMGIPLLTSNLGLRVALLRESLSIALSLQPHGYHKAHPHYSYLPFQVRRLKTLILCTSTLKYFVSQAWKMLLRHTWIGLLADTVAVAAIPTITAKGSKFFTSDGDQFYVKGIAYQVAHSLFPYEAV
jgi:hypothetical protein